MSEEIKTVYDFEAKDILGKETISLKKFTGNVLIIVNVASQCGFTSKNYTELSLLEQKYGDQGLKILLFPCNQFNNQESGKEEEIYNFAMKYNPNFIVFEKVNVNGQSAHPLWVYLKKEAKGFITNAIKWNFTKILVNKNGIPTQRFSPQQSPLTFEAEIKKLLG